MSSLGSPFCVVGPFEKGLRMCEYLADVWNRRNSDVSFASDPSTRPFLPLTPPLYCRRTYVAKKSVRLGSCLTRRIGAVELVKNALKFCTPR